MTKTTMPKKYSKFVCKTLVTEQRTTNVEIEKDPSLMFVYISGKLICW